MKMHRLLTVAVLSCTVLMVSQVVAQNAGIAADKQKQANLEKINARQTELKKRYNSLTPEQAAAARQKANEIKRSGGKKAAKGKATKSIQQVKKPAGSAIAHQAPAKVNSSAARKSTANSKPVFMDENGKPKVAPKSALKEGKNDANTGKKEAGNQTIDLNKPAPAVVKNPATPAEKKTATTVISTVKPAAPAENKPASSPKTPAKPAAPAENKPASVKIK